MRVARRLLDAGNTLTPPMREMLVAARSGLGNNSSKDFRKLSSAISELMGDPRTGLPDPGEGWADAVLTEVGDSQLWPAVFAHMMTADGAKPSAKWLVEADKNRQAVGEAEFRQRVTSWMRMTAPPPAFDRTAPTLPDTTGRAVPLGEPQSHKEYQQASEEYRAALAEYHNSISEKNISILKGLAWYCSVSDSAELARSLAHMTEAAFGNVRDRAHGPRAPVMPPSGR